MNRENSMVHRVLSVGPLPPEKLAYALARYSRSADSIVDSLEWVRTHDSAKFLESFYFQYGHASIADLGHLALCFEQVSELAASEIEDEQLWDGQAKSSRYQDFSKLGFITPPELDDADRNTYEAAATALMSGYSAVQTRMVEYLRETLPRPAEMKPDAYGRNIAARAFDVARYLLFWGVPTNVGQVTSIRTLERQIRRLKASPYAEVREVADSATAACRAEDAAPTLAKYVNADEYALTSHRDLAAWAKAHLPAEPIETEAIDLFKPVDTPADIVATLLYPACELPFRQLYELALSWNSAKRAEVLGVALQSKTSRDDFLRGFRGGLYAYDMVIDVGAYRDLHRHRRCLQYRQEYRGALGYDQPAVVAAAGLEDLFRTPIDGALRVMKQIPAPASHYLLPFAARNRFLFKMDFAEAEYISRLRSGVKGHFSYREIAWKMKLAMERVEPELGRFIEATPPWIEDPLTR